jgi:hypothetical protein
MPANPKRPGTGASQSFTRNEIAAACELFAILARGGDARTLARSEHVRALHSKFVRMRASLERQRAGVE